MNKILIIVGPTATGKTDLAIRLAKEFNGEIISADSRQVYRGMSIGTGKDLPLGASLRGRYRPVTSRGNLQFYEIDGIKLFGYDVVNPDEEWSPAQFVKMAGALIENIRKRKKIPIVVGGDGFYIQALTNPPQTLYIQPDRDLREEIEKDSVKQLQQRLQKADPERFNRMNNSDRNNPRRLVRAIEVDVFWSSRVPPLAGCGDLSGEIATSPDLPAGRQAPRNDATLIGLTAPIQLIDEKIELRTQARLKAGAEEEVKNLMDRYGWNQTLLSTIAYKEWKDYFEGNEDREKVINKWTIHEKQYARKQMVWFKKQRDIKWFDISKDGWRKNIMSFLRHACRQAGKQESI